MTTAAFRRYRQPPYADVPRTEVHFMEATDTIGPLGADWVGVSTGVRRAQPATGRRSGCLVIRPALSGDELIS